MSIGVFLVDDHPTFRDGLRVAVDSAETTRVVGEADTGEAAVRALPTLRPGADVVLMDVKLTGCSGIEATRLVAGGAGAPHVLVISAADDDEVVLGALRAGAKGFLDKATSRDDLLHGIHLVAKGGAVFSPHVASRLTTYFSAIGQVPGRVAFPELTDRETEILDLLARGHDNRDISRQLVLAEKTIRNHITRIFMKLDVSDRTTAALRARNAGLGLDPA
ncbi:response regulator transcription factor [Nonomuraea cavernae]|uniref:DNA-binding response regulator n=1 Tax=Nonomuraea cavernae TaxID=2045107 RepID=A0A918DEF7_9ACTN|nr:response regulator transcription factor [Nonomuraea cavernae]MCA2183746.1 response regulator transcription factor [Nonomuraea cavernae]GGO61240.1 DNA-binding response regulator [Nonomuraea cavernae]